jgi:hypothetical protein
MGAILAMHKNLDECIYIYIYIIHV